MVYFLSFMHKVRTQNPKFQIRTIKPGTNLKYLRQKRKQSTVGFRQYLKYEI